MRAFLFVTAFTGVAAFASNRPDLNGTWQLTSTQGKLKFETLLIEQTPGGINSASSRKNRCRSGTTARRW